jgi:hypothetical protein
MIFLLLLMRLKMNFRQILVITLGGISQLCFTHEVHSGVFHSQNEIVKKPNKRIPDYFVSSKDYEGKSTVEDIKDTLIVNGIDDLLKTPDSQGDVITRLERCTVFVVGVNRYANKTDLGGKPDIFVKVKTVDGQIGYLFEQYLITKSQYKQHNDSIALWEQSTIPLYRHLIGTSYKLLKVCTDLPTEIYSGPTLQVGKDNRYYIVDVRNRYYKKYSYLFLVQKTASSEDNNECFLILDIVPIDWNKFDEKSWLWFSQCKNRDTSEPCTDIVAVYVHTVDMAKKGVFVKPQKAWKPDYTLLKLVEVPGDSLQCGSVPPEEYKEGEFPG